ncbi:hypothetical protein [Boseongicola aestuarii]|uniref:Uncharacterized protein n=1 Tax=Boseongicola aestuarii TaxID=1470561 RepID=A0A238J541_9RHOB|nr:hypothetical protein [Boseongicola aestuarii]SMX25818.1 hypothetical protein BOA8489_03963 [Boseongicola aestuarii]
MARPDSGFPGNALGTGKAVFTENFPPTEVPVGVPVAEAPPSDVGVPPVDPATGLPLLPVEAVLDTLSSPNDFPGQVPDDILDDLLF